MTKPRFPFSPQHNRLIPVDEESTRQRRRHGFAIVSLKDERLAKKVTLAFGFLAFIPLLATFWALSHFVFPKLQGDEAELLKVVLIGAIASIFVGYFVLKGTVKALTTVIRQARSVADEQLGSPNEPASGDEIAELARTFNRITQELEHKISELEMSRGLVKRLLARIGPAMVSHEGIDNLLELIVENIVSTLEAQMGSLMLIDGETQVLKIKTAWAVTEQLVGTRPMKVGEGIAGWVAQERRAMRGTGSPGALGLPSDSAGEGAVLCIPLVIRDATMGVLSVFRKDVMRTFTEDDELLLGSIGSQIAVAIENYRLNLDIERTYLETIMALAMAVEAKDPYSAGHSKRVGFYAMKIAEVMGADEDTKKVLQNAGLLHDVGKIGIKDHILLKADGLTPEELELMHQHPVIGEAILKPVRSLSKVASLIRSHHECYDGSGYPSGLEGEAIPLEARILTVADTYDAMVTDRPYRKRMSLEQAIDELRQGSGKQFDPHVVEAFLQFLAEQKKYREPMGS